MNGKYVAYYRVSTQKQGQGLGLPAQRAAVASYLNGGKWSLLGEFQEIESGRKKNRPQLNAAIAMCIKMGAILLIAKLDRVLRNLSILTMLRDSGVQFVCVDNPNATKFTISILAAVAEQEAEMISARTKAGLAVLKARGVKLGTPDPDKATKAARAARTEQTKAFAERMRPVIEELRAAHVTTLRGLAECLNRRGFKTPNGREFKAQSVANLCAYLAPKS